MQLRARSLGLAVLVGVVALSLGYAARRRAMVSTSATSAASARPAGSVDCAALAPCECAEQRGAQLLADGFAEKAAAQVSGAPATCSAVGFQELKAEVLAATGKPQEGGELAKSLLAKKPGSRRARRAQALVALNAGEYDRSDSLLRALLSEDKNDALATLYLAVLSGRKNHYNDAREGFLRVLHLNLHQADARFNLVLLTAGAGAKEEAEHHLHLLEQIVPADDARLAQARTALNGAPAGAPPFQAALHSASPKPAQSAP